MSEEHVAEESQMDQGECQQQDDAQNCICSVQALPLWVWGAAAFVAGYMMLQLQLAA